MAKQETTAEQKRLDNDIWIIVLVSLAVLAGYIVFQKPITAVFNNRDIPVLIRVLFAAGFQFGLAGLGITIVSTLRKESFRSHGLTAKGLLVSIGLCILCYVPYIVFTFATGRFDGYLPFQSVMTTREILKSGFPVNLAGMLITAVAWGFFEGFNYVFISDKINKRFPGKNRWLNWGAISCAILCVLIHGAIGLTPEGILEMLAIMIIIYGMLLVREFTGNAWGCVFIFVFLWNAF